MDYNLTINEQTKPLQVEITDETSLKVATEEAEYAVDYTLVSDYQIHLSIDGKGLNAFVSETTEEKFIVINGATYQVQDADLAAQKPRKKGGNSQLPTEITPQTPSVVVSVLVNAGDAVKKGQGVVVVSAMKMETTLNAPFDGNVTAINTAEGDKVSPGDILVDIEKTESDPEPET
jgi:biotin carboxyl carrier protein